MKFTNLDYASAVSVGILCFLGLINVCICAPLDQYFQTDETEINNPQRLQLLKELRDLLDIGDKRKETKRLEMEDSEYFDVIPQKRFRPFRTQTRAGGVALCLWKVCPAAPWLVSKRR